MVAIGKIQKHRSSSPRAGICGKFCRLRILPLLLASAGMSGCAGPGYYLQAVSGHWKLMSSRQEVSEVMAVADQDLASRLRTAEEILDFARQRLGLPAGGSYDTYVETGRPAVTWNVVVAPEFSLQARKWCFPVSGCVPYRGYFKKAGAESFAARQRRKGFDVSVTPVTAYSTLGWFEDPILDTMLGTTNTQLAAQLFHELAHQRLYLKGDTVFSESYATFVAQAGVAAWLDAAEDSGSRVQWERQLEAAREFRQLLAHTRRELSAIYASLENDGSKRSSKQRTFQELRAEYAALIKERWEGHGYFDAWFEANLNNAGLALYDNYQRGSCAFSELFRQAGGNFEEFHLLAVARSGLNSQERRGWLDRACPEKAGI